MSYSDADRTTYSFGSVNFAGGDSTQCIRGPKGKQGRLMRLHIIPTTTFAGGTTTPKMQVGKSGSLTAYANWDMGTAAAGSARSSDDSAQSTNPITSASLPADTDILLTFKAPTGGGAAGVGLPSIVVDWDW